MRDAGYDIHNDADRGRDAAEDQRYDADRREVDRVEAVYRDKRSEERDEHEQYRSGLDEHARDEDDHEYEQEDDMSVVRDAAHEVSDDGAHIIIGKDIGQQGREGDDDHRLCRARDGFLYALPELLDVELL